MNSNALLRTRLQLAFGLASVAMVGIPAIAQVVTVPPEPVVGSSNPATAEPPVTRPSTLPCTVTLFENQQFADYSAKPISYAPPTQCPGNWAKVVLTVDFTVTAGRQFDRTASLYLGNANIYFGTTAEPRRALSPSWHAERDVTDLSATFRTAQSGQAIVYNVVNSTYTSIIYGTARLLFYPADTRNPAPVVPDVVIPVSGANSPYELDTTASQATATFTAPRNVERAYLDVIAQSQSNDEFWYLSVPNDAANKLQTTGNTAFRETEVMIDGKPAGVAPVYPWIYTGGIDPYLWEPITGVQTLNFKPYRVDLTPFAGVLSDGNPHQISVSVFNANSYFVATANLLLYTDHFRAKIEGRLVENTLSAAPTPSVEENLSTDSAGTTTGVVVINSARSFTTRGYVNTSHGHVETTVEQKVDFNSMQTFNVGSNYIQDVVQTSTVQSKTSMKSANLTYVTEKQTAFPLTLNYSFIVNSDGTSAQVVSSTQKDIETLNTSLNGSLIYGNSAAEQVQSQDTLSLSPAFVVTAVGPSNSSATYTSHDTQGHCYSRKLESVEQVLTSVKDQGECEQ
jgi:hypothetical protein